MRLPSIRSFLPRFRTGRSAGTIRRSHGFLWYLAVGAVLLGIVGIAAAVIFVFGISGITTGFTAVMLTNIPETAAFVDLFNASQDRHRILLSYSPMPARDLKMDTVEADIVIGKDIGYDEALGLFQPIDYLFHENGLFRTAFYQSALMLGNRDGKQILIPVSFDMPAVYFKSSTDAEIPSLAIPVQEIRKIGGAFNTVTGNVHTAMGFSPLWYGEFLPLMATLFGSSFRETVNREVTWDEKAMQNAIQYIRSWITETNGGFAADAGFQEKYLYDPGYRLLKDNRVHFSIMRGSEFFLMTEEKRESLDFRWITRNDKIPVHETIPFLGIPKGAKNKRTAEEFIQWFFKTENQRKLIETSRLKRIRTFGIAGGFSSLIQVNEMVLPQVYPTLLGHIPAQNYFMFPSRLPQNWERMKKDVVIPWMKQAVLSGSETVSSEILREQIRTWRLSEGES